MEYDTAAGHIVAAGAISQGSKDRWPDNARFYQTLQLLEPFLLRGGNHDSALNAIALNAS